MTSWASVGGLGSFLGPLWAVLGTPTSSQERPKSAKSRQPGRPGAHMTTKSKQPGRHRRNTAPVQWNRGSALEKSSANNPESIPKSVRKKRRKKTSPKAILASISTPTNLPKGLQNQNFRAFCEFFRSLFCEAMDLASKAARGGGA